MGKTFQEMCNSIYSKELLDGNIWVQIVTVISHFYNFLKKKSIFELVSSLVKQASAGIQWWFN